MERPAAAASPEGGPDGVRRPVAHRVRGPGGVGHPHPDDGRACTSSRRYITFGVSPRASINMVIAAQALALVRGRQYVLPEDVRTIAPDVLRHRLVLSYEALGRRRDRGARRRRHPERGPGSRRRPAIRERVAGGEDAVDTDRPLDTRTGPAPPRVAGHPAARRAPAGRLPHPAARPRHRLPRPARRTSGATTSATSTGTSRPGWTSCSSGSSWRTASSPRGCCSTARGRWRSAPPDGPRSDVLLRARRHFGQLLVRERQSGRRDRLRRGAPHGPSRPGKAATRSWRCCTSCCGRSKRRPSTDLAKLLRHGRATRAPPLARGADLRFHQRAGLGTIAPPPHRAPRGRRRPDGGSARVRAPRRRPARTCRTPRPASSCSSTRAIRSSAAVCMAAADEHDDTIRRVVSRGPESTSTSCRPRTICCARSCGWRPVGGPGADDLRHAGNGSLALLVIPAAGGRLRCGPPPADPTERGTRGAGAPRDERRSATGLAPAACRSRCSQPRSPFWSWRPPDRWRPSTTPRLESTVILAMDVSNSMAANDVKPSRIGAAKLAARDFVRDQPLVRPDRRRRLRTRAR